ncbi:hypothetical protein ACLESO_36945 [Pyxidicoccus sp. 3LG]
MTYELDEKKGSEAWRQIYTGQGRSYTALGRSPAVYYYRARACNTAGCGEYKTGPFAVFNPPPATNLHAQYPFLSTHDQQNAQYAAATQGFKTEFKMPSSAPILLTLDGSGDMSFKPPPRVDGLLRLGQGFNLLKDEYAQVCIDTSHPAFRILSNPVSETSFQATRAVTTTHLRELLDVGLSGGLSASGEEYSVEVSAEKQRFVEQISDTYQESVVVKWSRKLDQWTLDSVVDPLKPDFVSGMLIPNNPNAQTAFRERCGDKYVHALTRGARLYMVFHFDARKFSATDRTQNGAKLESAIKSIVSSSGAGSVTTETQQLLSSLNVGVEAFAVGGDESIRLRINRDNFTTEFNAFVNSVSASNSVLVEHFLSHYAHPTQWLNYNYFQIFADYRVPLEHMQRWNAIDIELAERCKLFETYKNDGNYGTTLDRCRQGSAEVMIAKSRCQETPSWSGCAHPTTYTTLGGTFPGTTNLYNWLSTHIARLERETRSQSFTHHINGGFGDKDCATYTDDTCLSASTCAVDRILGSGAGLNQGFAYYQYLYKSPGDGGKISHSLTTNGTSGARCVRTVSTICTSTFGSTVADHNFGHDLYGQCPQTRQFALVF